MEYKNLQRNWNGEEKRIKKCQRNWNSPAAHFRYLLAVSLISMLRVEKGFDESIRLNNYEIAQTKRIAILKVC